MHSKGEDGKLFYMRLWKDERKWEGRKGGFWRA